MKVKHHINPDGKMETRLIAECNADISALNILAGRDFNDADRILVGKGMPDVPLRLELSSRPTTKES